MKRVPDIYHELTLDVPIQTVWKAISTSEGLAMWFMENTFVPHVGVKFKMQSEPRGNWDGTIECEVLEIQEPYKLSFSWDGGGLNNLKVTITLSETGEKTLLKLTHSGFNKNVRAIRDMLDHGYVVDVFSRLIPYVEGEVNGSS